MSSKCTDDNTEGQDTSVPRKVEAVVVCDKYSDFLEETLPNTMRNVDHMVVVTSTEDKETQRLCAKLDVQCLPTWHYNRTGRFDKAKAINHGLAHLSCSNWLLHLDADILLPDHFADWFTKSQIVLPNRIFGVDRFNVDCKTKLGQIKSKGWEFARKSWRYLLLPPEDVLVSTRVAHGDYEGWVPIGFFQLWHGSKQKRYPYKPNADAEHTDLLFGSLWPPEDRILIPEFFVLHLATSKKTGVNWAGRTSPKWS